MIWCPIPFEGERQESLVQHRPPHSVMLRPARCTSRYLPSRFTPYVHTPALIRSTRNLLLRTKLPAQQHRDVPLATIRWIYSRIRSLNFRSSTTPFTSPKGFTMRVSLIFAVALALTAAGAPINADLAVRKEPPTPGCLDAVKYVCAIVANKVSNLVSGKKKSAPGMGFVG
ncbi:hypothetical protein AB1N83_008536 [Pleurotus pulmonarius]